MARGPRNLPQPQPPMPIVKAHLADEHGELVPLQLLELGGECGGYCLYRWLFQPLGFHEWQWQRGDPWKLPFFQELRAAIRPPGVKRGRDGREKDAEGNPRPELLHIEIRGKRMRAFNSHLVLRVELVSPADQCWLFRQLLGDMDAKAAIEDRRKLIAPGSGTPPAFRAVLSPHLAAVRDLPAVHCAHWDNSRGRLRITVNKAGDKFLGEKLKLCYVKVKHYRAMMLNHLNGHVSALLHLEEALEKLVAAAEQAMLLRLEHPEPDNGDGEVPTIIVDLISHLAEEEFNAARGGVAPGVMQ